MYGAELWSLVQKDWMNGSELALRIAKLEASGDLTRSRTFHWERHVHLFTNQLFGSWNSEIELCLAQALGYLRHVTAAGGAPSEETARLVAELGRNSRPLATRCGSQRSAAEISTVAPARFSSAENGQPSSASSTASANVASSAPGTVAATVSSEPTIWWPCPSTSSITIWQVTSSRSGGCPSAGQLAGERGREAAAVRRREQLLRARLALGLPDPSRVRVRQAR